MYNYLRTEVVGECCGVGVISNFPWAPSQGVASLSKKDWQLSIKSTIDEHEEDYEEVRGCWIVNLIDHQLKTNKNLKEALEGMGFTRVARTFNQNSGNYVNTFIWEASAAKD